MVVTTFDGGEETLIYEPISFAAQRPDVNPDSPRHFQSKRRRNTGSNTGSSLLKQRPKSLVLFRGGNSKKEQTKVKRWNTLNEKSRISIHRTNSMDSVFGNSRCTGNKNSPDHGKPITTRNKVREIRKLNTEKSDEDNSLMRSKSDAGMYREPSTTQCPSASTKARGSCDYNRDVMLKCRMMLSEYSYVNRENSRSPDSLKTHSDSSAISSSNSSGFYDYSSAENEYDTLSSDNSSINTDDILFESKASTTVDKDKKAEGISYSKSVKKNRRPTSITDKVIGGIRRSGEYDDVERDPGYLSTTEGVDEVFRMDNVVDYKYVGRCINSTLSVDNTLSIHSAPSPSRTCKSNAKKKKYTQSRQARPKSLTDMTTVPKVKERGIFSYGRNIRIESVL